MIKDKNNDFLSAFFDDIHIVEEKKPLPDLPAKKQENIRFTDNFKLFKVDNNKCRQTI